MKRKVQGVGITDSKTVDSNGKVLKSYIVWTSILKKCYKAKRDKVTGTLPQHTISDEWLTYSAFKDWYDNAYVDGWNMTAQGNVDNKIFSKETCIFMPPELDSFVYSEQSVGVQGRIGFFPCGPNDTWTTYMGMFNHETKKCERINLGLFAGCTKAIEAYDIERERQADVWKKVMMKDYGWTSEQVKAIKGTQKK